MSLKLGHRILIFTLIPFGFVAAAAVGLGLAQKSTTDAAAWARHSSLVIAQIGTLEQSVADADSAERAYLIGHDKTELARFFDADGRVHAQSAALRNLVADNPSQEAVAVKLDRSADARSVESRAVIEHFRHAGAVGPQSALGASLLSQSRSAEAFRKQLETFAQTEAALQAARTDALQASITRLDQLLVVIALVALALTFVLLEGFRRGVADRIAALAAKADRLAHGLPLGQPEAPAGDDEVARADRALHDMAQAVEHRQEVLTKFRLLAENIRDIILFVRRSDARIVEVNDAAVDAYGYSREELLSMTPADIRTSESRALLAHHLEESDRGPVFYESTHRRKDGTTFPVEVTGAGATVNGQRVLVSIVRDVSERKRAEGERQRFFDASLDMMCVANFGGYFVRLNRAWERTLGYTRSELCAVPFVEFIHPQDRESTATAMRGLTVGESVVGFENRYRRKDGAYLWFSWSAIPSLEDGLIYAVARDVTERKRQEQELARSRDQATEASRVKSEFLANMSHEIRTPMNGIIGTTALLHELPMSAEQREYVEIIRESGEALLAIINQILDLSKLEAGKVALEVVEFSPLSVVESVTMLFAPAAREKGLTIQGFVAADVPQRVRGDAGQLRQVLINLAGNAVKFTEDGSVVIQATVQDATASDVVLRFSVVDTGVGLPAEAASRLFEPFMQGDASTTRRYGGTGLGLSISRRIVELMGGEIAVEPNEERGTTFWFTARFAASAGEVERPAEKPLFHGVRVLIADPDDVSRDVLHRYLLNWGMRNGLVASDAREAVDALRSAAAAGDPYDIAFVDAAIAHGGDGFARAVTGDARLNATRFVLMRALGPDAQALPPGFAYFLAKPIRQSYLFDCVAAALNKRHAEPPKAVPVEKTAPPGPSSGATGASILIAEDNPINRRLAAAQFKTLGVAVDFVVNGKEAVEAVAEGCYELVFMDCQMPEMDGFEATREIRKREMQTGVHVPIVAVTANAMEGDRETCIARGMDDYVSKPVDLAALRRALERWLPPPVDGDRIRSLFGDGDSASQRALLEATIEESKAVYGRLRSAVAASDGSAAAAAAHELKGFTANVGANRVSALAARTETAIGARDWPRASALVTALGVAVERMIAYAADTIAMLDEERASP